MLEFRQRCSSIPCRRRQAGALSPSPAPLPLTRATIPVIAEASSLLTRACPLAPKQPFAPVTADPVLPLEFLVLGFPRSSSGGIRQSQLLSARRKEIRLVGAQVPGCAADQGVHLVGGTPNLMPPAEFLDLMELLPREFTFSQAPNVAVEIDARTFTIELLKASVQPVSTARA